MDGEYRNWMGQKHGDKCVENLKKHGFEAVWLQDVDAAATRVLEMISGYDSYGFGGSDTTRQLGLIEALKADGKTIYDHWQSGLSKEEDLEIRLDQGRCDCFLCSANAISVTGEIVNVDGIGNRTNAMTFGPRKVVIIAGVNKLTPDLPSAIRRVHEVAGPMRARSLNMKTPCAETGFCSDCNVPQRICRVTTILHRKPMFTHVSVVLVNRHLGF